MLRIALPHSCQHLTKLALLALALQAGSCGPAPSGEQAVGATGSAAGGLVIVNPSSDRDYFHDFGGVTYGDVVTHTFQLRNTEDRPVTITKLQASCACSTPEVSYVDAAGDLVRGQRRESPVITIPPGVTADFKMRVDTRHVRVKNIDKLAMVRLACDSTTTPYLTFEMHLLVSLPYQVTPAEINLGDVPISTGARGKTDIITAIPGAQSRIVGLKQASESLEVEVFEEQVYSGTVWRISVRLEPPLEFGPFSGQVLLSSTGADGVGEGQPLEIPVRGTIVPDVVLRPAAMGFGRMDPEAGAQATAQLTALAPGHRVKVVDAMLQGEFPEGVRVAYEARNPDGEGASDSWTITITAPPTVDIDTFTGIVRIALSEPGSDPIDGRFVYRRR